MTVTVRTGVGASAQESSFMNATLQNVSGTHSASIAVHLPEDALAKAGVDPDDGDQVREWFRRIFSSAIDAGCAIEVEIGPDDPDGMEP